MEQTAPSSQDASSRQTSQEIAVACKKSVYGYERPNNKCTYLYLYYLYLYIYIFIYLCFRQNL